MIHSSSGAHVLVCACPWLAPVSLPSDLNNKMHLRIALNRALNQYRRWLMELACPIPAQCLRMHMQVAQFSSQLGAKRWLALRHALPTEEVPRYKHAEQIKGIDFYNMHRAYLELVRQHMQINKHMWGNKDACR
eukprot:1159727-Pelagomonas_calceolata.AAC.6